MCGSSIPEGRMVCYNCEHGETNLDTVKFRVCLNNIADITDFVRTASMCPNDVVVKSGNFAVNAKSIMGLYSLDLSKPVKVEIHGEIPYKVEEEMQKFVVN